MVFYYWSWLKLVELRAKFLNHEIIISGDLNARMNTEADYIIYGSTKYLTSENLYETDNFDKPRKR